MAGSMMRCMHSVEFVMLVIYCWFFVVNKKVCLSVVCAIDSEEGKRL